MGHKQDADTTLKNNFLIKDFDDILSRSEFNLKKN